jgi:hypothetical protein
MTRMIQQIKTAQDMVDLARYPIADLSSAQSTEFVQRCRRQYGASGLCMLPGFIRPAALALLAAEAAAVSGQAYFCRNTHTAWLTEDDTGLAPDDIRRQQEQTFVGSVAYDLLAADSHLRQLYLWDPLKDFIAAVLDKQPLYRFADPLGACSINVFVDGGEHGWHFDESEFTVTLMLQPPQSGGAFEYVPQIRGREDEHEIVADVLAGGRNGVVELPFTAGTLLIFGGRQTLHRVTRVSGTQPRLVPVLCYSEQPDDKNSVTVRQLFWGRSETVQSAEITV